MGTENHRAASGHLAQFFNEDRPLGPQVITNKFVVNDFVANVDRRTKLFERALNDGDGAFNAGAEAARIGEDDLHLHDSDNFHLEADCLSSHRVIEVEQGVRGIKLTQEAGEGASVRGSEFDD